MIWINRILKFTVFITLFSSSGIYGKDKIFLNHPVGINDRISSRFSKKPISGIVYRSFDNQNLQPKPIGELYSSVKTGIWTGWWGNGKPKYHGKFINSVKSGLWREWDCGGQLRFESVYINGRLKQIKNCMTKMGDSTISGRHVKINFKKYKIKIVRGI